MKHGFARILHGLMENRHLTVEAVSRSSGQTESTIDQLLAGKIEPTLRIIEDIAPALQISLADLLVIAGIGFEPGPKPRSPYPASEEIGGLIMAASVLEREQVERLVHIANSLRG